jgi:uncharacterized protein YbjQ (UPF0145 family)
VLGYGVGSFLENRHFKSIKKRELIYKNIPLIMVKHAWNEKNIKDVKFVSGSVVISVDHFKRFVAGLINIFGGRVSTYESLLDRARREAILRMKEEAKDASEIINVRIETSSISKDADRRVGSIEVFAYGTAIYRKD